MNNLPTENLAPIPADVEKIIMTGDLSPLNPQQRLQFVHHTCKRLGIDPLSKPFDYIKFQGKTILYANANCSKQLCDTRSLSVEILTKEAIGDIFMVTARAKTLDGRYVDELGAVSIKGSSGEQLANLYMKAHTKATRRAILSLAAAGFMDETEVETIPGAKKEPLNITPQDFTSEIVDTKTGEVFDDMPAMDTVESEDPIPTGSSYKLDIDWSQYKYKYHLPYKKAGKDMEAVRAWCKSKGWKWRPSKDKEKNPIPGGDDCWYTNDHAEKLAEYLHANLEYPEHTPQMKPQELFGDKDLPTWME